MGLAGHFLRYSLISFIFGHSSFSRPRASTAKVPASMTAAATDANLASGDAERPLDQLTDDELDEAVAREEQRVALLEKKLARSRQQNRLLELRKRGDLLDDELTASEAENPAVKVPDVRSRKQAIPMSSSAKPRGRRSDVSLSQSAFPLG